jgi:tetratricopeptide (TPR) repeat protein
LWERARDGRDGIMMRMRLTNPLALVTLAACVAGAPLGAQDASHSSKKHYREAETTGGDADLARAEDALSHNDVRTAEALLTKVVQAEPGNAVAWFDLGFLYNQTNRRAEAIAALRKSVAANPELFEANLHLGLALAAAGQPDAARYLRAATGLKPAANAEQGLARAWMALAQVLESSDTAGAIAAYREAATFQPANVAAHAGAAELLRRSGDLAEAEEEFHAAAALNPKSSEALAGLVNVYLAEKKFQEAETSLKQMVAADPANATAHALLGRVLAQEGHDEAAAAELEAALKLAPADAEVLRTLAGIYAAGKQWDKAAAEYRQLLQRNPRDQQAHFALGSVLLQQHDWAAAQAEFMAAVQLNPKDPEALSNLAVAAAENKQYALAIQAINEHARLAGETPGTYYLRATAYDNLHDWQNAAINYRAFLETPGAKTADDEWKARHRLIAIDPDNKTEKKKK